MAAGVTDKLWSIADLGEMVDLAQPKPRKRGPYKGIFSLGLSCLVSAACSEALKKPTSDEALAVQTSVINCEWKAANRFDDYRYKTIPELVQRVMDECAVERLNARLAFGLSPNDPRIDANEYKDALENIENERKKRLRP